MKTQISTGKGENMGEKGLWEGPAGKELRLESSYHPGKFGLQNGSPSRGIALKSRQEEIKEGRVFFSTQLSSGCIWNTASGGGESQPEYLEQIESVRAGT